MTAKSEAQGRIESIETGMRLLIALAEAERPQMLKAIAAAANMHPSKAHRYLVSFIRTGFVDRDPDTGRYRLGPASMQIGLSALGSVNAIALATQAAIHLRDDIDETISLAVWGSHGPTIVRIEEASRPVTFNARVGTILPLLSSSSGQVFAAFLPEPVTAPLVQDELKANRKRNDPRLMTRLSDAQALLAQVRERGLGRVRGEMMPGLCAIAAPIFDYRGQPVAAIAVVGPNDMFDTRWNGNIAKSIRKTAESVSTKLGYAPGRVARAGSGDAESARVELSVVRAAR